MRLVLKTEEIMLITDEKRSVPVYSRLMLEVWSQKLISKIENIDFWVVYIIQFNLTVLVTFSNCTYKDYFFVSVEILHQGALYKLEEIENISYSLAKCYLKY